MRAPLDAQEPGAALDVEGGGALEEVGAEGVGGGVAERREVVSEGGEEVVTLGLGGGGERGVEVAGRFERTAAEELGEAEAELERLGASGGEVVEEHDGLDLGPIVAEAAGVVEEAQALEESGVEGPEQDEAAVLEVQLGGARERLATGALGRGGGARGGRRA